MVENVQTTHHPRFDPLAGQPQDFGSFSIILPQLGQAIVGPAEEMITAIADRDGGPQPMIIMATKEPGLPALALAFQPTREQARRMSRTLLDFAEGRTAELLAEVHWPVGRGEG